MQHVWLLVKEWVSLYSEREEKASAACEYLSVYVQCML